MKNIKLDLTIYEAKVIKEILIFSNTLMPKSREQVKASIRINQKLDEKAKQKGVTL